MLHQEDSAKAIKKKPRENCPCARIYACMQAAVWMEEMASEKKGQRKTSEKKNKSVFQCLR